MVPGVEHGGAADTGAEAFRIGGDGGDGFCAGFHEDAEHPPAVVEGDFCNRWWQGEDDVEIRGRQDAGQLSVEPVAGGAALAGWAVTVAARVVKHMVCMAVPADEKPGPQCRGAAHVGWPRTLSARPDRAGCADPEETGPRRGGRCPPRWGFQTAMLSA